jgi:hypothetical protein
MTKQIKQTAVEWLVGELMSKGIINFGGWLWDDNISIVEIIEQAKEIEKEQIIDAHIEGQRVFDKYPHTQWTNDQAEVYYNQTFNTKEK